MNTHTSRSAQTPGARKTGGGPRRIAFQGEPGAYSHEALLKYFGDGCRPVACRTLQDVFEKVSRGRVHAGIVPIENSSEGSVNETYDLLLDSPIKISGEINLRISHCLIANRGSKLRQIRKVYSHPQALAQCKGYIRRLAAEPVPYYDTAGAVAMIGREGLKDSGAIASYRAAETYRLEVLARGIEDNPRNYTKFFILSKMGARPTGSDKTSIIFTTKHMPGALYRALGEFASRGINLTKIESRPTRDQPWEYNFYLDLEGHQEDRNVRDALKVLESCSLFVKILGSYPKADL